VQLLLLLLLQVRAPQDKGREGHPEQAMEELLNGILGGGRGLKESMVSRTK